MTALNNPASLLVFQRSLDAINQIMKELTGMKMSTGVQTTRQASSFTELPH